MIWAVAVKRNLETHGVWERHSSQWLLIGDRLSVSHEFSHNLESSMLQKGFIWSGDSKILIFNQESEPTALEIHRAIESCESKRDFTPRKKWWEFWR